MDATLTNVLAVMTWKHYTITTLIVTVCLLLMVIILLQKGRGGGLASAFGGGADRVPSALKPATCSPGRRSHSRQHFWC